MLKPHIICFILFCSIFQSCLNKSRNTAKPNSSFQEIDTSFCLNGFFHNKEKLKLLNFQDSIVYAIFKPTDTIVVLGFHGGGTPNHLLFIKNEKMAYQYDFFFNLSLKNLIILYWLPNCIVK